jgi:hypothetical protein
VTRVQARHKLRSSQSLPCRNHPNESRIFLVVENCAATTAGTVQGYSLLAKTLEATDSMPGQAKSIGRCYQQTRRGFRSSQWHRHILIIRPEFYMMCYVCSVHAAVLGRPMCCFPGGVLCASMSEYLTPSATLTPCGTESDKNSADGNALSMIAAVPKITSLKRKPSSSA